MQDKVYSVIHIMDEWMSQHKEGERAKYYYNHLLSKREHYELPITYLTRNTSVGRCIFHKHE